MVVGMDVGNPYAAQASEGGSSSFLPQQTYKLAQGPLTAIEEHAPLGTHVEVQGGHVAVLAGNGCTCAQEAHLQQSSVRLQSRWPSYFISFLLCTNRQSMPHLVRHSSIFPSV